MLGQADSFSLRWQARGRVMELGRHGAVMGILNTTPDSFSDGGSHAALDAAMSHAQRMIEEGALIIDIGGESTRPGAEEVPAVIEKQRVVPLVRELRRQWDGWISVDTWKAEVAAEALKAGADVINDVTGLRGDPRMVEVCRDTGCGVVVMHMQGTPRTMQIDPFYTDVVGEVRAFFEERREALVAAGIEPATLCFDPGIGFGKSKEHNLELLRHLDRLAPEEVPLLLGVSRKAFLGKILGLAAPAERDWATTALTARTREAGVRLHRVHAVRPNVEALRMVEAILNGAPVEKGLRERAFC